MPEVSVLISVHNPDRRQLKQAIGSILNQTYRDYELLIYDDGSDEAVAELQELEMRDPRVLYFRDETNHGLAYGLNHLVKAARGNYIARMDADDIAEETRLEKQVTFLDAYREFDFVGCNLKLMDEDDRIWGERTFPEEPTREDYLSYQPFAHPSMVFRRSALDFECPYGRDTTSKRGEDYQLLMRLQAEGRRGYNLQEPLLIYRESAEGYKRRSLDCQMHEVRIRWKGFKEMGLDPVRSLPYVVKPIVVWIIPNEITYKIKRMKSKKY